MAICCHGVHVFPVRRFLGGHDDPTRRVLSSDRRHRLRQPRPEDSPARASFLLGSPARLSRPDRRHQVSAFVFASKVAAQRLSSRAWRLKTRGRLKFLCQASHQIFYFSSL